MEARDFASGTSSRSSKLVHGGLRYLGQGEVGLVHEALHERRRLREMFPALVRPLPFLMPIPRHRAQEATLAAGFWAYDALSIGSGFQHHRRVTAAEARHLAPALHRSDTRGAWKYWDAQTDDAGLTLEVLRRAAAGGALVANYASLRRAHRSDGWWHAEVEDAETGQSLTITSRYIVNAGGVWAEEVGALAGHADAQVRPSKGVHLSISSEDLPIKVALAFPVGDGRMLFAIPWEGYVVVGTTDDDYQGELAAPGCSVDEADQLLRGVNRFFHLDLGPGAVLSRWAGVRPLVSKGEGQARTKDLSRKPFMSLGADGLLTLTGGKLTTFVRMAVDALDLLPGPRRPAAFPVPAETVMKATGERLPGAAGYTTGDVARACEDGMAIHLEDALCRRLRLGFLDTEAAWSAALPASEVMKEQLGWRSTASELARFAQVLERDFGHLPRSGGGPLPDPAGSQEKPQPDGQKEAIGQGL
ncbi:MAG: glycerol-3-phosphate dehydrogenase/oxidase [Candidatus Dormibacteria bacterium]